MSEENNSTDDDGNPADGTEAEEARQVMDAAVGACIDQNGVHVHEVSSLGWQIITMNELDEDELLTIADIAEALRVKRSKEK